MIPEQAKVEIIQKRTAGETWTSLAQWLLDEFGVEVHRTTIHRWFDREVYLTDSSPFDHMDEASRLKLDKKVTTYKAEAAHFKKLYEHTLKDTAQKEIITDEKGNPTVKNLTTGKTVILKESDVVYNERTGKSKLKRSYRRKN